MIIRKIVIQVFLLAVFACGGNVPLVSQSVSGILDTKFSLGIGAGNNPDLFYGAEEYANLRLRIPAGEHAVIHGAVNLAAAAGTHGVLLAESSSGAPGAYSAGENYAALMELERLYVQVFADALEFSAGLLRIPFGYSMIWGPMDFLNPRNPLQPDARYRGVLGITGSWFPEKQENMKFLAFAAAPKDPMAMDGGGARAGLSWDSHWRQVSAQLLYCFESPARYYAASLPSGSALVLFGDYPLGLHRMGLAIKADLELGLTAEFLYTLNPDALSGIDGLSASFGADYSIFDGKLLLAAEYLYSGAESVSAVSAALPSGNTGSHYLYASGTWKWSDFSILTVGCAANLEDISFTPFAIWEYAIVQAMTLILRAYVPLDRDSFNAGKPGELGPKNSGSYGHVTAGLRVRF